MRESKGENEEREFRVLEVFPGSLKGPWNHELSAHPPRPVVQIQETLTPMQGPHLHGSNFPILSELGMLGGA